MGQPVTLVGPQSASGANAQVGTAGNPLNVSQGPYPTGAIPFIKASGNVANAVAAAVLDSDAGKTTYLAGFHVTGTGATVGLPVLVTVAGILGGTLTYVYAAAVGALVANQALHVKFDPPLPASALDTDITVSCPALGAGNTNNSVVAHGFKL